MTTTFKKGDTVEIFEMWRMKQCSEGKAKLVKFIRTQDDWEYWTVKFLSDGAKVDRFILKESGNMTIKHTAELQIFGREHLKVNEATQTEIIKRYNSVPRMLEQLEAALFLIKALTPLTNPVAGYYKEAKDIEAVINSAKGL